MREGTGITVRRAGPADAAAMAAILNPIVRAGGTTALETEVDAAAMRALTFEAPGHLCVHLARDAGGRAAGFQWLERLGPDLGDIATFARLAPKTPGVGRALFPATRAVAVAAGLAAIRAKIRADNAGGLAYYAAMGFRDHAVERGVPLADGTPVDRVIKLLPLS